MKTGTHRTILCFVVIQLVFGPGPISTAFAKSENGSLPTAANDNKAAPKPRKKPVGSKTEIVDLDHGVELKGSDIEVSVRNDEADDQKNKDDKNKAPKGPKVQVSKITEPSEAEMRAIYEQQSPERYRQKLSNYILLGPNGGHLMGPNGQQELDNYAKLSTGDKVYKGVMRFSNESMLFAMANGIIQTVQLSTMYASNPVAFEQHIQSLTDPWGNIGFYAFMVANGFTEDFLRDGLLRKTPMGTKRFKIYSQMIPYIGMTAGSLASQFVGDFGQLMRACGWKTINKVSGGKANVQLTGKLRAQIGLDAKTPSKTGEGEQDPCELAWKQWTLEKKVMQYGPSLASMALSNVASTGLMIGYGAVSAKAKDTAVFKSLSVGGSKVVLFISGGPQAGAARKFAFRGLEWVGSKLGTMAGKVTQFTIFTGLDVAMHGWINDKLGNFARGAKGLFGKDLIVESFTTKAENLQKALANEKKSNWESSQAMKFSDDFMDSMNAWKEFNQSHPMTSYYAWVQEVNNLINMERLSFHYYNDFVTDIQKTIIQKRAKGKEAQVQAQAQASSAEVGSDADLANMFGEDGELENKADQLHESVVYRTAPLFGVQPSATSKLTNADYMKHPSALEADQANTVKSIALGMEKVIAESKGAFNDADLKILNPLIAGMKDDNNTKKGIAINQMIILLSSANATEKASGNVRNYVRKMYQMLGYPTPHFSVGESYAYAFEKAVQAGALDTEEYKVSGYLEAAKVPVWFGPYTRLNLSININPRTDAKTNAALSNTNMSNKLDYITYNMLCGARNANGLTPDSNTATKFLGINIPTGQGWSDQFVAPRMIKNEADMEICNYNLTRFTKSNSIYRDDLKDTKSGAKFKGALNAIIGQLRPDIKTLVNTDLDQKNSRLSEWWLAQTDAQITKHFAGYKKHFSEVAVELAKTMIRENSSLNNGAIENGIMISWMQQMRILSLVLGEMYKDLSEKSNSLKPEDFMDPAKMSKLAARKLGNSDDIFRFQKTPYNYDLAAMKAGQASRVLKFQYDIEQLMSAYRDLVVKINVVQENGHEVVKLNYTPQQMALFKQKQQNVAASLKAATDALSQRTKLSEKQQKLVQFLSQSIQSLAQEPDTQLNYYSLVDRDSAKPAKAAQGKCQSAAANRVGLRAGQVGDCP